MGIEWRNQIEWRNRLRQLDFWEIDYIIGRTLSGGPDGNPFMGIEWRNQLGQMDFWEIDYIIGRTISEGHDGNSFMGIEWRNRLRQASYFLNVPPKPIFQLEVLIFFTHNYTLQLFGYPNTKKYFSKGISEQVPFFMSLLNPFSNLKYLSFSPTP